MYKEKLSYSFANKLLTKLPEDIIYELEHPVEPTDAMDDGSRIEHCIVNGLDSLVVLNHKTRAQAFKDEKEYLLSKEISDIVAIGYSKEELPSAIKKLATLNNKPFLICLEKQYQQAKSVCESLSYQVQTIIKKAQKQVHFDLEGFSVPVHGYLDFVTEDCVYELKFTDPRPDKFAKQVINMGWDIQAYLYFKKAQELGKEFKWLVIGQDAPHTQRIYKLPDMRFIDSGESKFLEAEQLFIEFNKGNNIEKEHFLDAPQWMS